MKETTLRLGYSALNNREALMIREGLITSYDKDFEDRMLTETSKHTRVDNKRFLLFSLILFDKIDASHLSMFNMDIGVQHCWIVAFFDRNNAFSLH